MDGGAGTKLTQFGDHGAHLVDSLRAFTARLLGEVRADRVTGLAAEVAFFSVLSIFPWLLLMTAGLGWLDTALGAEVTDRAENEILAVLDSIFTERGDGVLRAVRGVFEQERTAVAGIGAVLALWSSARGFAAVMVALNLAYDVEERRSWLQVRVRALGLALASVIATAVLLAMFVAGPLFGIVTELGGDHEVARTVAGIWSWLRWPLAVTAMFAGACVVYIVGPNERRPWRQHVPGAVAATFGWLAAAAGFRAYLALTASANAIYGTLGGGLVLLVWVFALALLLLVGAEINGLIIGIKPQRHTA